MTMTQKFLLQLEKESAATRNMLSIVPDNKFNWQPHPKSMSLGKLSTHIAELPGWITITMDTDRLDIAKNQYDPLKISSREELMDYFEKELTKGYTSLQHAKDEDLQLNWTMHHGDRIINVRLKEDVIQMCISQIIHHRAQLGVFLRLLDVPIPGSYGPSADELNR